MNTAQRNELFKSFTEHQSNVLNKKGKDYANADTLSNFKMAGAIANQNTEHPSALSVLNLIATKVARLGNLLSENKDVQNESIEDSVLDLANFTFLLHCVLREEASTYVGKADLQSHIEHSL